MTGSMAMRSYLKTNVETADNLKLIIMCYDAAIRDLEEARRCQENHLIEATYKRIRHAQDIITELLVGLDYERGGTVAQNLSRIYNYILRQLVGININKSIQSYDHLIRIMSDLKGAWQQLREQNSDMAQIMPSRSASPVWGVM
jgi:flagellar secretion chaperone FliS